MYPVNKIKANARFIDLTKDYGDVKLILAGNKESNSDELFLMWYNFPDDPTIIEIKDFDGEAFPDLHSTTELFGRYVELKEIYTKARKSIEKLIYKSPLKKAVLQDILDLYIQDYNLTNDEGEALLKLSIAKGLLQFEKQKGGDFVKLASFALDYENKKRFLEAIADEIVSKSERIELLVKHTVSKGNYREELLRGILKKYLPKKYEVATGFIEGCKRQCDILIYDSQNFSPLFREGDLVVLPEKAVRAVIEVKSTLDSNQLGEAMDLLCEVARHRNSPAPMFKGIFAFQKGYETENGIAKAVKKYYNSKDSLRVSTHDILYLYEAINAICVLNEQCLITDLIDYKLIDSSVRPRLYSIHSENTDLKLFCTSFLNELFSFLDVDKHAKKVNINYFKSLDYEVKYKMELALYDKTWKPSSCFKGEHAFDFDSIWERTSDVLNWKVGNYSIQNLEEKYFASFFEITDYKERFSKKK